jgi:hypothetical protein
VFQVLLRAVHRPVAGISAVEPGLREGGDLQEVHDQTGG